MTKRRPTANIITLIGDFAAGVFLVILWGGHHERTGYLVTLGLFTVAAELRVIRWRIGEVADHE